MYQPKLYANVDIVKWLYENSRSIINVRSTYNYGVEVRYIGHWALIMGLIYDIHDSGLCSRTAKVLGKYIENFRY